MSPYRKAGEAQLVVANKFWLLRLPSFSAQGEKDVALPKGGRGLFASENRAYWLRLPYFSIDGVTG